MKKRVAILIGVGPVVTISMLLAWVYWTDIKARFIIHRFCVISRKAPAACSGIFFNENINTYDDSTSSRSIERFYRRTVEGVSGVTGKQPVLYQFSSASYPRLHAVWQNDGYFLVVKVGQGNDNDHIHWLAASGIYAPTIGDDPYLTPRQGDYSIPLGQ